MTVLIEMKRNGVRRLLTLIAVGLLLAAFACGQTAADKSDPPAYTQALVKEAMERYEKDGREKTLAYYNSDASRDGEWYVFIFDGSGEMIAHFNQDLVGQNLNEEMGIDTTGRAFGPEFLTATSDGKWASYVFHNPVTNAEGQKHSWIVKGSDVFFGAGWYEGIQ